MPRHTTFGQWQRKSHNATTQCQGAVGNGFAAMQFDTTYRQVVNGTTVMHGHTTSGHMAMKMVQCTATLLGGSR